MFYSYIFKSSALIYSKKKLRFIYSSIKRIKSVHFLFTSLKPSCSPVNRILHILSRSRMRWTLIKCHCNCRSNIGLNLHALFWSHKYFSSIYMRVKINPFFFYFSESCK